MEELELKVHYVVEKLTKGGETYLTIQGENEDGENVEVRAFGKYVNPYRHHAKKGKMIRLCGKWHRYKNSKSFKVTGLPSGAFDNLKTETKPSPDQRGEHDHLPIEYWVDVYDYPADSHPKVTQYRDVPSYRVEQWLRTYQAGDRYYPVYLGKRPVAKITHGQKVYEKQVDAWRFYDASPKYQGSFVAVGTLEWLGSEYPKYEREDRDNSRAEDGDNKDGSSINIRELVAAAQKDRRGTDPVETGHDEPEEWSW